ncbi:MAG: hypothetical protein Fur0037_07090 [Planctomycetota bacterium]
MREASADRQRHGLARLAGGPSILLVEAPPVDEAAATPRSLRARLRGGLARGALTLWLPALLPFVIGPMAECDHCVATYLKMLPVEPGWLAAAWIRGSWGYVAAACATLLLLALCSPLLDAARAGWPLVGALLGLASAAQALLLGAALHM